MAISSAASTAIAEMRETCDSTASAVLESPAKTTPTTRQAPRAPSAAGDRSARSSACSFPRRRASSPRATRTTGRPSAARSFARSPRRRHFIDRSLVRAVYGGAGGCWRARIGNDSHGKGKTHVQTVRRGNSAESFRFAARLLEGDSRHRGRRCKSQSIRASPGRRGRGGPTPGHRPPWTTLRHSRRFRDVDGPRPEGGRLR